MKIVIGSVLVALLAAAPAAAIMEKMDLPTLFGLSDEVIQGKIVSMESVWDYDQSYIYTYITVAVENTSRDFITDREITVRIPGGEANGLILYVTDIPTFEVGESVVAFVSVNDLGSFDVVGGFQGKLSVVNGRVLQTGTSVQALFEELATYEPGR